MKKIIVLFLCAAMLWPSSISLAGPKGGKVVGGNAQISQKGPSTTINQTTDRAIINWNSFDINKNESVRHNMPSSNSAGLHRVVGGGGASQIAGSLQSNGNIYLVNPAGVVIHNGAKIDVNGFVATSRDISDQNFMKGNMVFDRPGHPDAKIINKGNITLKDNGLAVLVAPTVRNDGVIAGKLGKVALGGSDAAWKLDMTGDDLIAFTLDEKAVDTLHSADGAPLASVENNGKIKAEGGVVVMSAAQLDGFVGSVVNNGEISAASVESKAGKIIFRGQGNTVDLVNNGKLDVSSQTDNGGMVRMSGQARVVNTGRIDAIGEKGGNVVLTGKDITLKTGSVIDASGMNGGGTVLVGGNRQGKGPGPNAKSVTVQSDAEILSSARLSGHGGEVVVWADEKTQFDGKIVAKGGEYGGDGGFVETSAKLLIIGDPAVVNTSAKMGKTGTWLMDPEDFVIAAENGNMTGHALSANLDITDMRIDAAEKDAMIYINDLITWAANTTLILNAYTGIYVNGDIRSYGDHAKLEINTEHGFYNINNGTVSFYGTEPEYIINGDKYTLIKSINDLQNLNFKTNRYYALAHDIDASSTASWNNGQGFIPLHQYSENTRPEYIYGTLNGGNHIIKNLVINKPDNDYIGLFSCITGEAKISNLGLVDANIIGRNFVGGIVGASLDNAWLVIYEAGVSGTIYGAKNVGGVIGRMGNYDDISYSYSQTTVRGTENIGGFVGAMSAGSILSSFSEGEVYGDRNVGGFAGLATGALINSYSRTNIHGNPENTGGFAGYAENANFYNCYSTGSLLPPKINWEHGFIGDGKHLQAERCYVDVDTSYAYTDPMAGYGVDGVSSGFLKSGKVFYGLPWIESAGEYPTLAIYDFNSRTPNFGNGENNSPSIPNPAYPEPNDPIQPVPPDNGIINNPAQTGQPNAPTQIPGNNLTENPYPNGYLIPERPYTPGININTVISTLQNINPINSIKETEAVEKEIGKIENIFPHKKSANDNSKIDNYYENYKFECNFSTASVNLENYTNIFSIIDSFTGIDANYKKGIKNALTTLNLLVKEFDDAKSLYDTSKSIDQNISEIKDIFRLSVELDHNDISDKVMITLLDNDFNIPKLTLIDVDESEKGKRITTYAISNKMNTLMGQEVNFSLIQVEERSDKFGWTPVKLTIKSALYGKNKKLST